MIVSSILWSALWFVVGLGLLVTLHEYGHYWVAKRYGVRIKRFSVGMGPVLASRFDRDGVQWAVSALPLGGYVMFDRAPDDEDAPRGAAPDPALFESKPVLQRMAITAAGPAMNLALCLVLLWAMFVVGRPDFQPLVGTPTGAAAEAGFERGDRLLAIDGQPVATWTDASMRLMLGAIDREVLEVEVERADGVTRVRRLDLAGVVDAHGERQALAGIGLPVLQRELPPVVGQVVAGSPADGLLDPGDRILAVDGQPIAAWDGIGPAVAAGAAADRPLRVEVERGGQRLALDIQPRLEARDGGEPRWILGVGARETTVAYDSLRRFGPLQAIPVAAAEMKRMTSDLVGLLGRMLTGRASLENISGPVTIARYAGISADLGLAMFLSFLAFLSLSLGVMNLLPIPVLDGGQLLYYLIELIKGSPVSEKIVLAGQKLGVLALVALMGLAFFNDFRFPL